MYVIRIILVHLWYQRSSDALEMNRNYVRSRYLLYQVGPVANVPNANCHRSWSGTRYSRQYRL